MTEGAWRTAPAPPQDGYDPSGPADLADRVRALGPWFHNLRLGDLQTAPDHALGDHPADKLRRIAPILPEDLRGCSVLDIGCNAGFWSFEMERRGAARVLGIDHDPRYLAQARLAAGVLGSGAEFRQMEVWDLADLGERFDLVLFLGVLYHLRHPLLALDLIRDAVCADRLLFQTHTRGGARVPSVEDDIPFAFDGPLPDPDHPALFFVERAYGGDWTNWWLPNPAGAEAMLRAAGFAIEARTEDVWLCRTAPVPFAEWGLRPLAPIRRNAEEGR